MAAFCRRCGAEIVTANLMDIDPGMDRAHFALLLAGGRRRYLQSMEWRLFAALYRRHGRVVSPVELARATHTSKHQQFLHTIAFARARVCAEAALIFQDHELVTVTLVYYNYEPELRADEPVA